MHALMAAVLVGMTGLDGFNSNPLQMVICRPLSRKCRICHCPELGRFRFSSREVRALGASAPMMKEAVAFCTGMIRSAHLTAAATSDSVSGYFDVNGNKVSQPSRETAPAYDPWRALQDLENQNDLTRRLPSSVTCA